MPPSTNVRVDVESVYNKKGVESAKTGIDQLAQRANKAKAPVGNLGDKTAKLGASSGVAGTRVGGLTQALFRGMGVTAGVTEVSIAAGTAIDSMAGKMALANAAIAGGALALAVLVPKLIEWLNASKKVKEEQVAIRDAMLGMLQQLETYVATVPQASEEMREFAKSLRAAALLKQAADIEKLKLELEDLDKAQKKHNHVLEVALAISTANDRAAVKARKNIPKLREEGERLQNQIDITNGKMKGLIESQKIGMLVQERLAKGTAAATAASELRKKALEDERKAQDDLNAAIREGALVVNQSALAKDAQAVADRDAARGRTQLEQEEWDRFNAVFNSKEQRERDAETARQRILRQERKDVRAQNAWLVADSLASAQALFGQNKALAISSALADTYAAANAALATVKPTVPAGVIAAALVTANGLANVANIRKQEAGFDDPLNDALARRFGEKFAVDMMREITSGFQSRLAAGAGGGSTTIDRSTNFSGPINIGAASTAPPTSRQALFLWLEREMIRTRRLENRTRIPR